MHSVSSEPIRTIIIDDELVACTNLKHILLDHVGMGVEVVATATDVEDGLRKIRALHPDVVFLDIELGNETAFHLLERIGPIDFEIIFVTAYDEYALKAFKLNAVDYILKPISIDETTEAIQKLKGKLALKQGQQERLEYRELTEQMTGKVEAKKIFLRDHENIMPVPFEDIYFVEAKGSYATIYYKWNGSDAQIVMGQSIADYENLLPPEIFYRSHKSYLINGSYISKLQKGDNASVVMADKFTLPVGRRRYTDLINFVKNFAAQKK